jgi:L-alanine-DL-glutamate epimerase-like enolase superfamily enzyme
VPGNGGALPAEGLPPPIDGIRVASLTVPTDVPESDGTLAWDSTTMVIVELAAAGVRGLGYSYADATAARLVVEHLAPIVRGAGAWDTAGTWSAMVACVRNLGRPGVAATAISATDVALWDLKARLLGVSLADLLGRAHARVLAYGSGGFTSYPDERLEAQLGDWAAAGFRAVKMKVGRDPAADPHRVDVARRAIGPSVELFVDANGAYGRREALRASLQFERRGVAWYEEPVSSDDIEGLRFVRDHVPPAMAVAAGEYGWGPDAFRSLVATGAVDVLQADATRCLGVTGFLLASAACEAWHVPLSSHCAPALHAQLMAASRPGIHMEWFHDHVRIEQRLFEGAPEARDGYVAPDRGRPGLGLELRPDEAAPYVTWRSA